LRKYKLKKKEFYKNELRKRVNYEQIMAERENAYIQKIDQLKNIYAQLRGENQNEKENENENPQEGGEKEPETAENQNEAPPPADEKPAEEKPVEIVSNPEEVKTGDN